jgi:hypothetical protein
MTIPMATISRNAAIRIIQIAAGRTALTRASRCFSRKDRPPVPLSMQTKPGASAIAPPRMIVAVGIFKSTCAAELGRLARQRKHWTAPRVWVGSRPSLQLPDGRSGFDHVGRTAVRVLLNQLEQRIGTAGIPSP